MTLRSGLTPSFGRSLEGPLGRIIDIVSVIATILSVSVILGHGVSQFVSGVYNITSMGRLMNIDGSPSKIAMIVSLMIVMVASTLSALSGVGKGIKWLSNIKMGLSFFVLAFFGPLALQLFAVSALFVDMGDYIANLPMMILTV